MGAVMVRQRVLATGYNGAPSATHCTETGCLRKGVSILGRTSWIAGASRKNRTPGSSCVTASLWKALYSTTNQPCITCAKLSTPALPRWFTGILTLTSWRETCYRNLR